MTGRLHQYKCFGSKAATSFRWRVRPCRFNQWKSPRSSIWGPKPIVPNTILQEGSYTVQNIQYTTIRLFRQNYISRGYSLNTCFLFSKWINKCRPVLKNGIKHISEMSSIVVLRPPCCNADVFKEKKLNTSSPMYGWQQSIGLLLMHIPFDGCL